MTRSDDAIRPGYAAFTNMQARSTSHAEMFARQILATCASDLAKPEKDLDVLDVGSGYGPAALVLSRVCRSVVGIEPAIELHEKAIALSDSIPNLTFRHCGIESLEDTARYDLIVLDNVYEHLPNQREALARIDRALRPGGVVYLLMPNRLWPREVHYGLPFLSWLPLPIANRYLRLSGRGSDYTDASYARTYWTLRRELDLRPGWSWRFTLPAVPEATHLGTPLHYRVGMAALRRVPALWAISKALLVVVKKDATPDN